MRQLNNKHFDTIEGASARQGEVVSSASSPLVSQRDEIMKSEYNVGDKVQLNWEHSNEVATVTEIDIREKWDGSKLLTEPIIAFQKKEDEGTPYSSWAYFFQVKKIVGGK